MLKIAFIGNGKSTNRYHAPFVLTRKEKFQIKTIWRRNPDHDSWAKIPGVNYTTDINDIYNDPEIDLVCVCTSSMHYEFAKDVLNHGKNCLVEKPFVNTYAQAKELFDLAKEKGTSYSDRMNDVYLYEKADEKLIKKTYADVIEIMNDDIHLEDCKHTGLRGFLEDNFGVIAKYDEDEDKFNTAIEQEVKIEEFKHILALNAYPGRLFPIPNENKNPRLENVHYLRHYSIWSIVALFFIFAFIGWSWEVALHLVKDGVFINRGVNHGPWLPIYGCGGALILLVLYRLRKKPALHIVSTIALCGIVEYFTSWYLELTKNTKWWDYSGYFLNINGRICAEGLIVFAIGGTAVVYALGPIIDNHLRKVNQKTLKTICSILLVIFLVDIIYSSKHPNVGKGITDYDNNTAVVEIDNRYKL